MPLSVFVQCIDQWLIEWKHTCCPLCKMHVLTTTEAAHQEQDSAEQQQEMEENESGESNEIHARDTKEQSERQSLLGRAERNA